MIYIVKSSISEVNTAAKKQYQDTTQAAHKYSKQHEVKLEQLKTDLTQMTYGFLMKIEQKKKK